MADVKLSLHLWCEMKRFIHLHGLQQVEYISAHLLIETARCGLCIRNDENVVTGFNLFHHSYCKYKGLNILKAFSRNHAFHNVHI